MPFLLHCILLLLVLNARSFSATESDQIVVENGLEKGLQSDTSNEDSLSWNLSQHFKFNSIFDPSIWKGLKMLSQQALEFQMDFHKNIRLERSLEYYENNIKQIDEIKGYIELISSLNWNDIEIQHRKRVLETFIDTQIISFYGFYERALYLIKGEVIKKYYQRSNYIYQRRGYISRVRVIRQYQLPRKIETILNERYLFSVQNTLNTIFRKKLSELTFSLPVESCEEAQQFKDLSFVETQHLAFHEKQCVRKNAALEISKGIKAQNLAFIGALLLDGLTGNWYIEIKQRRFQGLRSLKNITLGVPKTAMSAFLTAIRTYGYKYAKRYYEIKKRALHHYTNTTGFAYYDRLAPIHNTKVHYTLAEALVIVKLSLGNIIPNYDTLLKKLISEHRIQIINSKTSAYAPIASFTKCISNRIGPFILVPFNGTVKDVMRLSREIGHASICFEVYDKGHLQHQPSTVLTETLLNIYELVTYNTIVSNTAPNSKQRLDILIERMDFMMHILIRHASLDLFEERIHLTKRDMPLDEHIIERHWVESTKSFYGAAGEVFDNFEGLEYSWVGLSHIFQSPFALYIQPLTQLLAIIISRSEQSHSMLQLKSAQLLENGHSIPLDELVKRFLLLDINDTAVWEGALHSHFDAELAEIELVLNKLDVTD